MLVLHYVSIQDPTPLPYLQHSDAFNFDINLEVQLKGFCEWLLLFFFQIVFFMAVTLCYFTCLCSNFTVIICQFCYHCIYCDWTTQHRFLSCFYECCQVSVATLFVSLIFIAVINDRLFTVFVIG